MRSTKRAIVTVCAVLAASTTGFVGSQAHGAGKAAQAGKAAKVTKPAVAGKTIKAAAKKGPGMCGTYLYWKGAKCMDARDKK